MNLFYYIMVVFFTGLVFPSFGYAQLEGFPSPSRSKFFEINLCYSDKNDATVCEAKKLPELVRNFGNVGYIDASPLDPTRNVANLPNYALARYHWWFLGFDVLPRVQRQYSDCVERVKVYQELLGISPLIDAPGTDSRALVDSIREYLVPMDAIQRYDADFTKAPGLADAIGHAQAAIDSINVTVFYKHVCEGQIPVLKALVQAKLAGKKPKPHKK